MPLPAARLARAAAAFVAIGLVLYAALYAGAEQLLRREADANAFHRIAAAPVAVDWLVLGSSHALPLAFGGFNERMEQDTGMKILNLGTLGAGPLYNRLVFEQFAQGHRAARVLYVVDSFAFQSRAWNEERIAEPKLLARTPWDASLAARIARYVRDEGVSWRGALDYAAGFSKINNRERFARDVWEGAKQFDAAWRESRSAVRKRIEYLYPDGMQPAAQERYLAQLAVLVRTARAAGAEVTLVKLPLPGRFRDELPGEAAFDEALARTAAAAGASRVDFSALFDDPRLFFDSDHLNRAGAAALFERGLREVLVAPRRNDGRAA